MASNYLLAVAHTLHSKHNKWVIRIKFTGSALLFCMKWWDKPVLGMRRMSPCLRDSHLRICIWLSMATHLLGADVNSLWNSTAYALLLSFAARQHSEAYASVNNEQRHSTSHIFIVDVYRFAPRFYLIYRRHYHRRRSRSNVMKRKNRYQSIEQ